jgi:glycerol-3-phosphate dehydrogenase
MTSAATAGGPWRTQSFERLRTEPFDLLVIGGGITGAGIARDAALRGLRTALLERDDFASGTSSRSSRLVHGGVRYLEHGYLHLVFEASRERRTLLRIAPHLVRPVRFTWPFYRGARLAPWKVVAGLWLYDLLALFRNVGQHKTLSATRVLQTEPALQRTNLAGGATYWDAATDDARLTVANVLDASTHGAVVLNHADVTDLVIEHGRAVGARGVDRMTGTPFEVRARGIVNATGPWTDTVRAMEGNATKTAVRGTKGVHIAVPAERVGNQEAITVISSVDQRVMFVLPGATHTIIGTTDTPTHDSPEQVRANQADVNYLLDSANAYFPAARLTPDDVVAAWAGIRPLIASDTSAPTAQASREHAIATGPAGVIQITGGKLTTYRAMAAEVTDAVHRALGEPRSACRTADLPLPPVGEEFACTVADILVRRTSTAFDTRDHGRNEAPSVARRLGDLFNWDAARCGQAVVDYAAEVDRLFTIDP